MKFQLFAMPDLSVLASGMLEKIGEENGLATLSYIEKSGSRKKYELARPISDHRSGVQLMTELLQEKNVLIDVNELAGVGHRVVHGGEDFKKPVIVTDVVMDALKALIPLAPLHNPANITGIEASMRMVPGVPQVAVFDTAFHQSIPEHAYLYGLPYELYEKYRVRRYGFHGTSYSYVSRKAAEYLNCPPNELKSICLHLGNGASIAAIDCGKCVDTSMGLTPLEGLVMGTRSGDLDPAILFYLARETGMDLTDLDTLLNKKSGLKGICDNNDMRSIGRLAANGDLRAQLAIEIFCYRIKKYVGAYLAVLGSADCLVFTGGIGENDTNVRNKCLQGMEKLGISLDPQKNSCVTDNVLEIQGDGSSCKILVIPTNEELEIASQTLNLIA